jgi:hypothetical protein
VWNERDSGSDDGYCDGSDGGFTGIRSESKGLYDDDDNQAAHYNQTSVCTRLTEAGLWKMGSVCSSSDEPDTQDKLG